MLGVEEIKTVFVVMHERISRKFLPINLLIGTSKVTLLHSEYNIQQFFQLT